MSKELYEILNVPVHANIQDIQNSYIYIKKELKNKQDFINLNKLNEAFNVISNVQTRKLYDQGILNINLDLDLDYTQGNLFFENIGLKNFLKNSKKSNKKGANINKFIDISLAEAYAGCQKKIIYSLKIPCELCAECCTFCLGKKYSSNIKSIVPGLNRIQHNKCTECNELGYVYKKYSTDKCINCTGTGKKIEYIDEIIEIPQAQTICNTCKGTKKYIKRYRDPITEKKICTKCFGKGIKKKNPCFDCNGNGYINTIKGYNPIYKTIETVCDECNEDGMIIDKIKTSIQKKTIFSDCNVCCGKGFNVINKGTCKICNNMQYTNKEKTFFLNLYPGIENGKQFIIPKNGEQILEGDPGNLIITINLINSSSFKRIENNLKLSLIIHFVKTIVGAIYKITLPSNEVIIINTKTFNEIINPLKLYVYKNKGMPIYCLDTKKITGYGDLYIQFNVIYGKISQDLSIHYIKDLELLFSKIYDTLDDNSNEEMTIVENNIILNT